MNEEIIIDQDKTIQRLHERIKKAIEYINKSDFIYDRQYEKHDKLLNILQGEDNGND